jgi:hypothetical protein
VLCNASQQSVQWIGGILRDLQTFFLASSFFCSQTFSQPARQPLTQTVSPSFQNEGVQKTKRRIL